MKRNSPGDPLLVKLLYHAPNLPWSGLGWQRKQPEDTRVVCTAHKTGDVHGCAAQRRTCWLARWPLVPAGWRADYGTGRWPQVSRCVSGPCDADMLQQYGRASCRGSKASLDSPRTLLPRSLRCGLHGGRAHQHSSVCRHVITWSKLDWLGPQFVKCSDSPPAFHATAILDAWLGTSRAHRFAHTQHRPHYLVPEKA